MQIISLKKYDQKEVVKKLKHGATIIYPTETCYGLGCDATNAEAVEKLYKIKGRPEGKPFIVIAASLEMMAPWVEITPTLREIEMKYWPGAVTVVSDSRLTEHDSVDVVLPAGVVGEDGTIAFRVSSNEYARELCAALGRPIVSTSANLAGEPNVYSAAEIKKIFSGREFQPDIIIDSGDLPLALPTTLVRVDGEKIIVLRQGGVLV